MGRFPRRPGHRAGGEGRAGRSRGGDESGCGAGVDCGVNTTEGETVIRKVELFFLVAASAVVLFWFAQILWELLG